MDEQEKRAFKREILHEMDEDLAWKLGTCMVIIALALIYHRYC